MIDEKEAEAVAVAIYQARNGKGCVWWGRLPHSHQEPYLSDARAAISAIQALSPGSTGETDGWKPIETAPKDGTVVDIWAGKRIANCQWRDDGYYEAGWWFGDHGRILDGFATHWRPLPSPPSAMLAAAGGQNG